MSNPETELTLDDGVAEVFGILTGLDLQYEPDLDRYQAVTRAINRAMRAVALEREWSWYADTASVGPAVYGEREVTLAPTLRPRMIGDDAVRLVDSRGIPRQWAYFLPRDALYKYNGRNGLWCAVVRNTLSFSRNFKSWEAGLDIQIPVMREPTQFRLPLQPEDPDEPRVAVPEATRLQKIDFQYPDLVIRKAAQEYAMSDPVMQPRVQTLEAMYKDLMYQIIEREERMTDSPYQNEFFVPIQNGLSASGIARHSHPHSDERR
jgi:hypothetical protein